MKRSLLIRADADSQIGTGHVMRMVALGQAWRDRVGDVVFVTDSPECLADRLVNEGFETHRLPREEDSQQRLRKLADRCQAAWVVFDGYHFSAADVRPLRAAGLRVLLLDDYGHQSVYEADILLNQSTCAFDAAYRMPTGSRILSGPKYALLRQEFVRHPRLHRPQPDSPLRVLLSMGGADANNVALKILRQLAQHPLQHVRLTVLLGALNPHREEVSAYCPELSCAVDVRTFIHDMASFLHDEVDFAISAGGTTVFELAHAGLPMAVVQTAENQKDLLETLVCAGAAFLMGSEDLAAACTQLVALWRDFGNMRSYADAASRLVDGRGAQRVVQELRSDLVVFRRATLGDAEALLRWRNSPPVRRHARQSGEISLGDHRRWLANVLDDPARNLLIGCDGSDPVGVVRFDVEPCGTQAEVSIYLVPEQLNRGWGTPLLMAAVRWCWANTPVARIKAVVLPDNAASHAMFQHVGFATEDGGSYALTRRAEQDGK